MTVSALARSFRVEVFRAVLLPLLMVCTMPLEAADELHVEGVITSILARDLDGDGRRELWVSHHENGERRLALFRPRSKEDRAHLYGRVPDRVVPVDPRAVMFAVGDFTPTRGNELVFLSAASAVVVPLVDGATPERLFRSQLFFGMPSVEEFPPWLSRTATDLDGDGYEDWVIPERDRLRILLQRRRSTARSGEVPTESEVSWEEAALPVRSYFLVTTKEAKVREVLSRFVDDRRIRAPLVDMTSTFPFPFVVDFDGDGLLDIVVKQKSYVLEVFRQSPRGSFSTRPSITASIPWASEATSIALADADGNGKVDVIASRVVLGKLSTDIKVFIQDPEDENFGLSSPRQVLRVNGVFVGPTVADGDGDGRLDLLVASYRVDLLEQLRAKAVNEVEISYQVYPAAAETPFARRPAFQRTFLLSTGGLDPTSARPHLFAGRDLTGDGRSDILWIDTHQDLRLYRATGEPFRYEDDAGFRLKVSEPREVELVDLDGEAGEEVVLVHERHLEVHRWSATRR